MSLLIYNKYEYRFVVSGNNLNFGIPGNVTFIYSVSKFLKSMNTDFNNCSLFICN